MALRITRRSFVGWLVRSASAATAAGLLLAEAPGTARAATVSPSPSPGGEGQGEGAVPGAIGPVSVRMADITLAGHDLRTGLADGVRLPGQGGDSGGLTAERPGATYTTPTLQAEFSCTHVGVHWRTDGGDQRGLRVEVRASRDGQTWMPWRPVQPEAHGRDRDAAGPEVETFGALVGARLGAWFQARLTFEQAGPETASVRALTLTCLDSRRPEVALEAVPLTRARERGAETLVFPLLRTGEGDRLPAGAGDVLKAGVTGFLERVVTREAWGADESLRFKGGVNQWEAAYVTPSLLVVHHTAGDSDIVDAEAEVRSIYAYHAITQGWGDIGYNLLIDSSGRVYEGRYGRDPDDAGRREIVSENIVAGHALDYNYGSAGAALLGNFQTRTPGQAQLDALVEALAFLAQRAGIDPTTTQSYARARGDGTALWRDQLRAVSGHRDCIATECPGDNLYPLLPSIRQRVEEQLGARGPAVGITRGPADKNPWPGDIGFTWDGDPAAVEFSTRLAGWRRFAGSDTIEAVSGYDADQRPIWSDWTRDTSLVVSLAPNARGMYTLFVQGRDLDGRAGRIVSRRTFVVDRHVVVDDESRHSGGVGDWRTETTILGYYGTGYKVAEPSQPPPLYVWTLHVPEDGAYRLQATWTATPDRTTEARYVVAQQGAILHEASVNQQEGGGAWAAVVDLSLVSDAEVVVMLHGADDGVVVADAIRLARKTDN